MAITVKRKEGEPMSSFLYRANRRIQQSGILALARKRRFKIDVSSRNARRVSALERSRMQNQIRYFLKQGLTLEEAVDRARKVLKDIIKK